MKNYATKRARKGRIAYRTPDRFIYQKCQRVLKTKERKIVKFF